MEELDKVLDDLITCVKESDEYRECIRLKNRMSENRELIDLIDEVKFLQKKYIKSNYDDLIKKELDIKEEKLKAIPIYVMYTQTLNKVNDSIDLINNTLNNYFDDLLN